MKVVLISFEAISELQVNINKSMLVSVNVAESWLREASLGMNSKIRCLPFVYLGLPISGDPC